MPDHNIAHRVYEKQKERREIEKTVEIQEFFESERLETLKDKKARVLKED